MVYEVNLATRGSIGIKKKMLGQAEAFSLHCRRVEVICLDRATIIGLTFVDGKNIARRELLHDVGIDEFFTAACRVLKDFLSGMDVFYFRFAPMRNAGLADCLRLVRESGYPVFLEVPTYPYIKELSEEHKQLDATFQPNLNALATTVFSPSVPSHLERLFGSPLVRMQNGIACNHLPIQKPSWDPQSFDMIAIGWLARWHGFDRVVHGLRNFARQMPGVRSHLHIVGEGPFQESLKDCVRQEGCGNQVTFWESTEGEELDAIFARCQLGIGSLGWHRTEVEHADTLKSREYVARGLPVVLSYDDTIGNAGLPGIFRVSADDRPIDLTEIYNQVREFFADGGPRIHWDYARTHYDWSLITRRQMETILSHISQSTNTIYS